MTPLQWVFHYFEIVRYRTSDQKREQAILDIILERTERSWMVMDPERGIALLNLLKESRIKKEAPGNEDPLDEINEDNFAATWEELMTFMPQTLQLPKEIVDARKFVMKAQSRKDFVKGIQLT